jgi:hypothetical protein
LPNKRWERYGQEDVNDAIIEILNRWVMGLYEGNSIEIKHTKIIELSATLIT